jgi:hypothetical protein
LPEPERPLRSDVTFLNHTSVLTLWHHWPCPVTTVYGFTVHFQRSPRTDKIYTQNGHQRRSPCDRKANGKRVSTSSPSVGMWLLWGEKWQASEEREIGGRAPGKHKCPLFAMFVSCDVSKVVRLYMARFAERQSIFTTKPSQTHRLGVVPRGLSSQFAVACVGIKTVTAGRLQ